MLVLNNNNLGGSTNVNTAIYKELKTKVENIIYYLNASNERLDKVIKNLSNYYKVNNSSSELENQVTLLKTEIYKTSNYLKKTVLPEINTKL